MKLTDAQIAARKLLCSQATYIMLAGGSRSGKSAVITRRMLANALRVPCRQTILRRTFKAVKATIGLDTLPKIIRLQGKQGFIKLNKTDWIFSVHDCEGEGSEIWLGGLDDKERVDKILGMEYATVFCNECSEMTWDSIETLKSRLAQNVPGLKNRMYFDQNPTSKSHWSYKLFIEKTDPVENTGLPNPDDYVFMRMNPQDNAVNLPKGYIENTLEFLSSKKKARFLKGEWTEDNENALWNRGWINPYRVKLAPESLERIVIGVDPAVTNKEGSDSTGIVVAGKKKDHFYILEDRTMKGSPKEWADSVHAAFNAWKADRVVVETNNGGDLVTATLRNTNKNLPITSVHAKRGKILRAEPIAGIYEEGRVHHVGEFLELEDQMCDYTGADDEPSPDNLDAMVYAITALTGKIGTVTQASNHFGVF